METSKKHSSRFMKKLQQVYFPDSVLYKCKRNEKGGRHVENGRAIVPYEEQEGNQ